MTTTLFKDFTSKLDPSTIPAEVVVAAQTVDDWMQRNGHCYWQFMNLCDRAYADEFESAMTILNRIRENKK